MELSFYRKIPLSGTEGTIPVNMGFMGVINLIIQISVFRPFEICTIE